MHGTDEVIPGMTLREFVNPVFVAGNVIDFEREFDGEFGKLFAGVLDFGDVFVGVAEMHVPIIEIVARHGVVFAEADFFEADFDGVGGVFDGLADGVPAERRVHVVISRKTHGSEGS